MPEQPCPSLVPKNGPVQKLQISSILRSHWSRLGVIKEVRVAALIAVCCLVLFLLGSLELWWAERVKEVEQTNLQIAARNSIRLFNRNLQLEVARLLTFFGAEPSDKLSNFSQNLDESILAWHSSARGPAINRVLFYDAHSPAGLRLAAFKLAETQWEPIPPEGGYQRLEARLQALSSEHRRRINDWSRSTWLYYPDYSALVRPVASLSTDSLRSNRRLRFRGYLVLQLDVEYVLDQVMPELLRIPFRDLASIKQLEVALAVNGDAVRFYRFSPSSPPGRDVQILSFAAAESALAGDGDRLEADWVEAPGLRRPLLLTAGYVPDSVSALGGSQRIGLGSYAPYFDLAAMSDDARERISQGSAGEPRVRSSGPLRVRSFVAAGRPYQLELIVKKDAFLHEIFSVQYRKNVVLGWSMLLLLAGVMTLVIVSVFRASNLAKARLEFATAVSHELRTPVTAIRAIGDNMTEGMLGTSERTLNYGKIIREEAVRLSEMIEQSLKIAAFNSGSDSYDVAPVDTAAVVDKVLERARPTIDQAGFVLEHSDADDIPPVLADETALIQSIDNLLSNAIKYGLPERWVKLLVAVVAVDDGSEVQISVHDRGPGVSRKDARRIFEPYYRSDTASDSKIRGFGLGLYLAERMVHAMGGRLTLSSNLGEGSVFTIHLPVAG